MIDPILYTIRLGGFEIAIRWYGLLIVLGTLAGAFYASWYVKRRKGNPDIVWDVLIWLLLAGIVGARLGYVLTDIFSGNSRYLVDPVQIFKVWEGGLNILGGILLAALAGWYYTRRNKIDFWFLADAITPGFLIGQAIGRIGNYINQEIYGGPTTLSWGIPIDAAHRVAPWDDLTAFPLDTTRFHPIFAYEMIWSLIFAAVLIWLVLKYQNQLETGVITGAGLFVAGVGRFLIEYFRPDQPHLPGTPITVSAVVALLIALLGVLVALVKRGQISVPFMSAGSLAPVDENRPVVRRPARSKSRW